MNGTSRHHVEARYEKNVSMGLQRQFRYFLPLRRNKTNAERTNELHSTQKETHRFHHINFYMKN